MTTALQIITRSLLDLNVVGDGESPTANQASDALVYLNDMLQAWTVEGMPVYAVTKDSLTVTGATSYTIGSGGTFNTARPNEVLSAYFTLNGVDYPIDIINREQYESIADKDVTASIPDRIYVEYTYPLATMYVYPVPSTGTLNIASTKPFSTLTLSTSLAFPTGYERAIRLNLAVELMPMYGINQQILMAMAQKAKYDLKRLNAANMPIVTGLGLPVTNGMSDIYRGWNGRQ